MATAEGAAAPAAEDDRAALRPRHERPSDNGVEPGAEHAHHHEHNIQGVPLIGLLAGMCMSLIAGAPYAFGVYAEDLKHTLGLSQTRMALLGVAYDFGLYLAQPVSGTFFDTFGTPLTIIMATIFVAVGNGAVAVTMLHVEGHNRLRDAGSDSNTSSEAILAVCFFVTGMAASFINVGAFGTNVKRSKLVNRARVIAAHSTCFGLSSLLVASTYPGLSHDGRVLSHFFFTWAVIGMVVVGTGGMVLMSRAGGNPHPGHLIEDYHREHFEDVASPLEHTPQASLTPSRSHSREGSQTSSFARGLPAAGAAPEAGASVEAADDSHTHFVDAQAEHDDDEHDVPIAVALRDELTSLAHLANVCMHADFWLLELTLFVAFGSGLFVINSTSAFVASAGGTVTEASIVTSLFPIGNAGGRFIFGLLSNKFPLARRGHWLTYALLLFALVYACASATYGLRGLDGEPKLWPVYTLVLVSSMAYGTTWVAAQAILAENYPIENFGTMFGLIAVTAGMAGLAYNSTGALLYEAVTEEGSDDCVGPQCFRRVFAVASCCATVGIATSLLFAPYTRRMGEINSSG